MTRRPALIIFGVALAYCVFLGAYWLPLDHSDKELAGFVSRLWDIQREFVQHHRLPWWTPYYMSGSSYGLNHSQGFYLLPGLLLASVFDFLTAVKLTALLAILGGTMAMYGCARHFLKNEQAAVLAALAWLFHPEQVIRAAGAEHLGISVFLPFVPLSWWLLARALETRRFVHVFGCALVVCGGMWAHNKMMFVNLVFLAGYLVFWLWPRRGEVWRHLGTCALIGACAAVLGAFFIVPGLSEAKYVKLFEGDPIREWQKNYAFRSLLALVDRDGVVTRDAVQGVMRQVQSQGGVRSQAELDAVRHVIGLQMDSPEKYAGLALLAVIAVTILWNRQRIDRKLFWFFVGCLLVSVMLASGLHNVWSTNLLTWSALFDLTGVPSSTRSACVIAAAVLAAFLVMFWRRKLTTAHKRIWAGGALLAFALLPAFSILATVPFYKEVRAPYVFYDVPAVFLGAMLLGFFVTDFLPNNSAIQNLKPETRNLKPDMPHWPWVFGLGLLLLIDFWPYQKPAKDSAVPPRTLANLRGAYHAIAADPDWVKTYA